MQHNNFIGHKPMNSIPMKEEWQRNYSQVSTVAGTSMGSMPEFPYSGQSSVGNTNSVGNSNSLGGDSNSNSNLGGSSRSMSPCSKGGMGDKERMAGVRDAFNENEFNWGKNDGSPRGKGLGGMPDSPGYNNDVLYALNKENMDQLNLMNKNNMSMSTMAATNSKGTSVSRNVSGSPQIITPKGYVEVEEVPTLREGDSAPRFERKNKSLLMSEFSAPWPTSASSITHPLHDLKEFSTASEVLIREYLYSGDYEGFVHQIRELSSEAYHDVMVKQIVETSISINKQQEGQKLLLSLAYDEMVQIPELVRGICGVAVNHRDVAIDMPCMSEAIVDLVDVLAHAGLVEESFMARLPVLLLEQDGIDGHDNENARFYAKELRMYSELLKDDCREYLQYGEYGVLSNGISNLNKPNYTHEFVRLIVDMSLDFGEVERRMLKKLFLQLKDDGLLMEEDVQHGMALVLSDLEEIQLDVPHCGGMIAGIMGDCIRGELLAAEVVKQIESCDYGLEPGKQILIKTLKSTPEYSRRIWHGRGTVFHEMDLAIMEYFDSRDLNEVARIVGELHLNAALDAEFVQRIVVAGLEKRKMQVGLNLIHYMKDTFWAEELVGDAIMDLRGMQEEYEKDIPGVHFLLDECVRLSVEQGLLGEEFGKEWVRMNEREEDESKVNSRDTSFEEV